MVRHHRDVECVLVVEMTVLAAIFVSVVESAGLGEFYVGELGVRNGEEEEIFFSGEGRAGLVAQAGGGERAEELFGGPLGGVHVGEGGSDVGGVSGVGTESSEGGVDVFLRQWEMGAAEDDFLQGWAVGIGAAVSVGEGADVAGDLLGERDGKGGIALNDGGEGGAAVLGDAGSGASCKTACALDRTGISAAGAGADGGENGDATVFGGREESAGASFDNADDRDGKVQFFDQGAEIFEAIGGGGVASDDEGFNGGLGQRLAAVGGLVTLAEQEEGVFEDEFAQVREIIFGGVIAVGHVGLIAKVDEAFVLEVGATIGAWGEGVVVKGVDFEDFLQHGETADAGVEHADGEMGEVALEGIFLERERGVASGMGLDMGDDFFQDGFSLSK